MALQAGDTMNNRYHIIQQIAETESAIFYRAEDILAGHNVLLKQFNPVIPDQLNEAIESARILAGLRHPNLMRITDQFEGSGGSFFQVTDMAEGLPILDIANFPQGLPVRAAMPIVLSVCDALYYLHSNVPPIVHNQINLRSLHFSARRQVILQLPNWIIESTTGNKILNQSPETTGSILKDIYDLGLTIIELLSGQSNSEILMINTVVDLQDWFHQYIPALPENLIAVLTRVVNPDTTERYAQIDEFKSALLTSLIFLPPEPAPDLTITRSAQFQIPPDVVSNSVDDGDPRPLPNPEPLSPPSTPIRRRVPWGLL